MERKFKDEEPQWLKPPEGYEERLTNQIADHIRTLRSKKNIALSFPKLQWMMQLACFTVFLTLGYSWYLQKKTILPNKDIFSLTEISKQEVVAYLENENLNALDIQQIAELIPEKKLTLFAPPAETTRINPEVKEVMKEIISDEIDLESVIDEF